MDTCCRIIYNIFRMESLNDEGKALKKANSPQISPRCVVKLRMTSLECLSVCESRRHLCFDPKENFKNAQHRNLSRIYQFRVGFHGR